MLPSNKRMLGKRPWPRFKTYFKDEIVCQTRIKIMSIIISFEGTSTPVIDILTLHDELSAAYANKILLSEPP